MTRKLDGLPRVTEETFMDFLRVYDLSSAQNNPEVTLVIQRENPQIYRILQLGMKAAPTREARAYYECGMQICYELLRRQTDVSKRSKE
ncbi:MAG: hypothetical protein AABX52_03500 [Nanoarchaeota archaeon]